MSLGDVQAFVAVAQARGFREAARAVGSSASGLTDAVRRLEARLGVRLLHRTTRTVALTEAGEALLRRVSPALEEIGAALEGAAEAAGRPAGTLRLNVPVSAARLVLPRLVPGFLAAYPGIRLDVTVEDRFVDLLEVGCDAGIRYEERLEQDMVAVPIGPRRQRFAAGAAPDYLARHGAPAHPRDLLGHACLRQRFTGAAPWTWPFEQDGATIEIDPPAALLVNTGAGSDLAVDAAIAGAGVIYLFEEWLRPHFDAGRLVPVLEPWWPSFAGPYLFYPGRRLVPGPLRVFVDYVRGAEGYGAGR